VTSSAVPTVTTTSSAAPTTSTTLASTTTTSSVANAQPSVGAKVLQYWTWWNSSNPSFASWWQYVKPDYESKHPGQSLQISFVADDGDYETKLLAAVAGGVPPDVLHLDIVFAWDTWKHGVLADLSPYVARTPAVAPDQFFAAAKTYTQQAGHTFGVATEGPAGYALAYNLDHFKEVGLAPAATASWTWQEFADAAAKLTKRSGDTITQSGWLGAAGSVEYFCDWLYSDGGTFYNPDYTGVAFDDGRGAAVLQFMSDMLNKNRVSATLPTGTTPYKAFVAEQASMMTFGMYLIPSTAKQAPLLHYDLMPFPRGPEGKGPATALEYDMEVVPKDAKDQDASWA
jgi:ABC-type glycerol-3-phosphate transport system substrate-binding protein